MSGFYRIEMTDKKAEQKTIITVKLTPRSPHNEIAGIMENGMIKIRLNAPPVEGKANAALIKFLASLLGVSESSIEIISGATSHTKMISIFGIREEEVKIRLRGDKG